jgi:hypothetical protein
VISLVNMIWELVLLWLESIIMLWVSENKLWEVFNIRGICKNVVFVSKPKQVFWVCSVVVKLVNKVYGCV